MLICPPPPLERCVIAPAPFWRASIYLRAPRRAQRAPKAIARRSRRCAARWRRGRPHLSDSALFRPRPRVLRGGPRVLAPFPSRTHRPSASAHQPVPRGAPFHPTHPFPSSTSDFYRSTRLLPLLWTHYLPCGSPASAPATIGHAMQFGRSRTRRLPGGWRRARLAGDASTCASDARRGGVRGSGG